MGVRDSFPKTRCPKNRPGMRKMDVLHATATLVWDLRWEKWWGRQRWLCPIHGIQHRIRHRNVVPLGPDGRADFGTEKYLSKGEA